MDNDDPKACGPNKEIAVSRLICTFLCLATFALPSSALAAKKAKAAPKAQIVEFKTSLGKFRIELNAKRAPLTVANFLAYVKAGHYKGTVFHRVIPGFMVQGGGMTADMVEKPTRAPIKNEADNGLKNLTGTVAMARTSDPHSASAQFFINVNNNHFLNHKEKTMRGWGYTVFGRVISGMDVVNKIRVTPTGKRGFHSDVPRTPIVIVDAKVVR